MNFIGLLRTGCYQTCFLSNLMITWYSILNIHPQQHGEGESIHSFLIGILLFVKSLLVYHSSKVF